MANRHGDFIWYELLTSDPAAAEQFYGAVLGWRARRAEGSPVEYHMFGTTDAEVEEAAIFGRTFFADSEMYVGAVRSRGACE